ncbi:hypothetical protein JCM33374_g4574 [Metschnikowia sp. JCM 33374]|nr:hypothetical protein JCM33374_g4574 [Metschnikowia sp. JCM 33374]
MAITAMFPGKIFSGPALKPGTFDLEMSAKNISTNNATTHSPSGPPAIVLWHGLGDNYNSGGMKHAAELISQLLPDTFVHSVYVDEDPSTDERRSLFGNANSELELVCSQLSNMTELKDGFGAIGFSQGGLFLRALVQRCPEIAVSTLVTFGSPHMGVSELPICQPPDDWACKQRNSLLKRQVWQDSVQRTVVPAQYFRDTAQYDKYLKHSSFLADLNNERVATTDPEAKRRFENLQKLVLVQFDLDTTLVPKESAFFQERHALTGAIVPMSETRAFKENLFGLRTLHEADKIEYHTIEANHMQFSDDFLTEIVTKYFTVSRA